MRALSIRQPFAELILRGRKTIEYRSRPTRIVGERFYLYASLKWAAGKGPREGQVSRGKGQGNAASSLAPRPSSLAPASWSLDLAMAGDGVPPWMIELAEGLRLFRAGELPTGVIVGTAVIDFVEMMQGARDEGQVFRGEGRVDMTRALAPRPLPLASLYAWHLADVERLRSPRRPTGHPQPVWFKPF